MYQVYLNDMELPLAPSKITTKINNQNKTVNLVNEGEYNILKLPGLTDINFKMRIPHFRLPVVTTLYPVDYYLNKLELFKVKKQIVRFIVVRNDYLYDTNMAVTVEDYIIDEDSANGHMTVIDIDLKQFIEDGDIVANLEKKIVDGKEVLALQVEKERLDTREIPRSVKANRGDTLWKIAKKYLGDGSKYSELAKINNISNPNGILEGQVIRLE